MEDSLPIVWQPNACNPEPSPWIQLTGSSSLLAVVSDLDRDGIETLQAFLTDSPDWFGAVGRSPVPGVPNNRSSAG